MKFIRLHLGTEFHRTAGGRSTSVNWVEIAKQVVGCWLQRLASERNNVLVLSLIIIIAVAVILWGIDKINLRLLNDIQKDYLYTNWT